MDVSWLKENASMEDSTISMALLSSRNEKHWAVFRCHPREATIYIYARERHDCFRQKKHGVSFVNEK